MTKQDPEILFKQIAHFIDESNMLIKAGEFVRLTDLDVRVSELCAEVLKLSGAQRVEYADRLQQLIDALQMLGMDMIAARDEIGKQLGGISTHKKAHVAYQKISGTNKKKQEE